MEIFIRQCGSMDRHWPDGAYDDPFPQHWGIVDIGNLVVFRTTSLNSSIRRYINNRTKHKFVDVNIIRKVINPNNIQYFIGQVQVYKCYCVTIDLDNNTYRIQTMKKSMTVFNYYFFVNDEFLQISREKMAMYLWQNWTTENENKILHNSSNIFAIKVWHRLYLVYYISFWSGCP